MATAPLPVVLIRLAGYVAFALFAGVAAFVLLCAPDSSRDPTLQLLVRGGLLGGAVAAVAAILVQGPLHRRGLDETVWTCGSYWRPCRPRSALR